MKKSILTVALMIPLAAFSADALKEGKFVCDDKNYDKITLAVAQHPTKPNKITVNWEGRPRILHREKSITGAPRYEGAVSQIVYIQTPHHSVLLDNSTMKVILSECLKSER